MYIKTMFDIYINCAHVAHVYAEYEGKNEYVVYICTAHEHNIRFAEFNNKKDADNCLKALAAQLANVVSYYDVERGMFMKEE
jgi:hypothetical protein